ncbi:MAG: ribonuclease H-like domain-containing protein [Candidatus Hydrogenedentes bacterium]|nr:ribonuclease H-like domain-containing protein [Candidatus Hydrogenedentota bacterium]
MEDIKVKLKAMLADQGLMTGSEWKVKIEELQRRREAGEFEIDKFVPGEVVSNAAGSFYLVRSDFPLEWPQGRVELGAVLEVIPENIALAACDSDLERFNPSTALFLDTETSGIVGGTGTIAFLVGVGYLTEGKFRLEQCFLRDFDEETAMLHHLDPIFARAESVVSYNGKTFDLPLLRTRYITNRMRSQLDCGVHLDLLHAARRFWKLRLGDCSLPNIERRVLGIERHNDVPGEEIPQIWFDYLRTRDARRLDRVFNHHRMDILSLVALTAWLSRCLELPEGEGFEHAEDRLSLVRLHFRQRRFEDVARAAEKLLEVETEQNLRLECLQFMAFAWKRLQDFERMAEAWDLVLRESPRDLQARLELAKYYEHRMRDLPLAERLCVETVSFLETKSALGSDLEFDTWPLEHFQHRLDRIRRKLSRGHITQQAEDVP